MEKPSKHLLLTGFVAVLMLSLVGVGTAQAAQPTIDLQSATPFALLAGTPNITDVANSSTITGNVGLSPASGAGIGLLCSQVTGTIYSVDATGPLPCRVTNGPLLVTAKNDLTAAYIDAAGRTPATIVPTELGGTTKTAGVYASNATTFQITAGAGPLVIDGQNDPSSVFIFEMNASGTGLTVGPGSTVSLINGASACNIFWRVDTATINTTAVFKGTVLALTSISVANGANISGRLLARNGAVTLNNDVVAVPAACATAPTTSSGSGSSSSSSTAPTLPNTGIAPKSDHIVLWNSIILVGTIVTVLASFYLARKRRVL
ncbi:MAG TPA: ice-binding family protein [Patescibacteria group bacterium]|nr:ice-binding family protein [Patescibacteria group bacterium]